MTIPLALAAAGTGLASPPRRQCDEEDENGHAGAGGADTSTSGSGSSSCLAIVPVLRARFPHAQPHRLPLVVRTRASSHHIHFLMDEDEEEGPDLDEWGRVACRALVLHPTKHKSGGHHHRARVKASVDSLPSDSLKLIFRFLPAPSLCAAEAVCPLWRAVASEDDAWWGSLCETHFGVSPDSFTPPPDPVKKLFMLQHQSLRTIKYGGGGGNTWARFF